MNVGGAVEVADGSADLLVAPAEIPDAPAGREVDVLLAVLIEDEAAFRAGELQPSAGSSRARYRRSRWMVSVFDIR